MVFPKNEIDYSLYVITDRALMSSATVEECVERAIDGGCTLVQLREKEISSLNFYHLAERINRICDRRRVPLIINDRIDVALAVGAAGVHVGQRDLPAGVVRGVIGKDRLLGVSAVTLEQAVQAQTDGADYLGVGAMFPTGTKTDAETVTMEELKKIREAVSIPLVVIGGINEQTVPLFKGTGIDGLAVVSAVISAQDIEKAARKMKSLFQRIC
ncbi:MAG: thiamine-phosphate pyrophosphorylase [Verrucomicrobiota bacterium]|nr:thiamine-phosphate pyrophosphorylase [Verrucomicrobiota bacterium]MDK2963067.1 thiamine-phosphate pyrophosphorylase [Verrucomicrobiota bacterium]